MFEYHRDAEFNGINDIKKSNFVFDVNKWHAIICFKGFLLHIDTNQIQKMKRTKNQNEITVLRFN